MRSNIQRELQLAQLLKQLEQDQKARLDPYKVLMSQFAIKLKPEDLARFAADYAKVASKEDL